MRDSLAGKMEINWEVWAEKSPANPPLLRESIHDRISVEKKSLLARIEKYFHIAYGYEYKSKVSSIRPLHFLNWRT